MTNLQSLVGMGQSYLAQQERAVYALWLMHDVIHQIVRHVGALWAPGDPLSSCC